MPRADGPVAGAPAAGAAPLRADVHVGPRRAAHRRHVELQLAGCLAADVQRPRRRQRRPAARRARTRLVGGPRPCGAAGAATSAWPPSGGSRRTAAGGASRRRAGRTSPTSSGPRPEAARRRGRRGRRARCRCAPDRGPVARWAAAGLSARRHPAYRRERLARAFRAGASRGLACPAGGGSASRHGGGPAGCGWPEPAKAVNASASRADRASARCPGLPQPPTVGADTTHHEEHTVIIATLESVAAEDAYRRERIAAAFRSRRDAVDVVRRRRRARAARAAHARRLRAA